MKVYVANQQIWPKVLFGMLEGQKEMTVSSWEIGS